MSEAFFILDAPAHRTFQNAAMEGRDGEEVDSIIGKAVLIVAPPHTEWVCDFCNGDVTTELQLPFGSASLWPVPVLGSYALCWDCYLKSDDEFLEPYIFCGCPPCLTRAAALATSGLYPTIIERRT